MTLALGVVLVALSLLIDLVLRPGQPPVWSMLMGLIGFVVGLAGLGIAGWRLLSS